jgi:hypothetical protein
MGENDFELSIPPLLGLHSVFNVELLRPYFLPFLDTLDVAKHLALRELNLDYIKQVTVDQIMDTKTKHTHQQNIQLYWAIKSGQLLHQGKWLT